MRVKIFKGKLKTHEEREFYFVYANTGSRYKSISGPDIIEERKRFQQDIDPLEVFDLSKCPPDGIQLMLKNEQCRNKVWIEADFDVQPRAHIYA